MDSKYKIGDKVKDRVTGFTGLVTAVFVYATGMTSYNVQSQELKDGRPQEPVWFEEPPLELVEAQVFPGPTFEEPKFALGDMVRERICGFEGIVHSLGFWVHGCIRYQLLGTKLSTRDGTQATTSFDGMYLDKINANGFNIPTERKKTGGPEKPQTSH